MKNVMFWTMVSAIIAVAVTSCEKDDTDFSAYINNDIPNDTTVTTPTTPTLSDTVYVVYDGNNVNISGDRSSIVNVSNANVVVNDGMSTDNLILMLSGSTTNGSLLVYRSLSYEIILNGVSITNSSGPAINNQCHKALYITCAEGEINTLTDGISYTSQEYDQKGTLFSEGEVYFQGKGQLSINGNYKNGIATDDYITFLPDGPTIDVNVSKTGTNGVKANEGVFIKGGILSIDVKANGARGIRSESYTTISGGTTTISTSGDCVIETVDGMKDTTSCAGIKCDSLFSMTDGELTITSTGDGGKGVNCSENVEISGGTFVAKTTGDNNVGKPKAVKSLTGIIVSGGSFTAEVDKSWACDNGTDSEQPSGRVTIVGTPKTKSVAKKKVVITF